MGGLGDEVAPEKEQGPTRRVVHGGRGGGWAQVAVVVDVNELKCSLTRAYILPYGLYRW